MKRALAVAMLISAMFPACQREQRGPDGARSRVVAQQRPRVRVPDARPEAQSDVLRGIPIGVAECDEYLEKYSACLRHEALARSRARMEQVLGETREAWRQTATTAEAREGLAQACKIASEAAAKSMRALGCRW